MDQQASNDGNVTRAAAPVSWNPYVCQDCRGVFRVPRHHAGKAVVCPVCDRLLRLPDGREQLPPLVELSQQDPASEPTSTPAETADAAVSSELEMAKSSHERIAALELQSIEDLKTQAAERSNNKRKRKHRRRNENRSLGWENAEDAKVIRFGSNHKIYVWVALAVVVLGGLMLSVFLLEPKNTPVLSQEEAVAPEVPAQKSMPGELTLVETQNLEKALRNALAAKSVDVLLKHIRHGQALEQRVRSYYATHPLEPLQLHEISEIQPIGDGSRFYQLQALYGDNLSRTLFAERRAEGFFIDWESWVGWSAQDLAEVMKRQLKGSFVMRLRLENEVYYNFDFPPDQEHLWQSYRIYSADGASVAHGYAPKASALDADLRLNSDETERFLIVRFRYPDNSTQANQFLIEEVLSPTWFMAE